jgi:hypothetical protein
MQWSGRRKKKLEFLDDIRISFQASSPVRNSGTADNRHSDATQLTLLRQSCQHPVTAVSLMLLRRPHPTLSFYIPYNSTVAVRILRQELFRFRMNFLHRGYTRTFHATGQSRFLFFFSPKGWTVSLFRPRWYFRFNFTSSSGTMIDVPFVFRRPIKVEWDGLVSETTAGFRLNLVLR